MDRSHIFNDGPLDRARRLKAKHLRVKRQLELGAAANVVRLPKAVPLARELVIAYRELASAAVDGAVDGAQQVKSKWQKSMSNKMKVKTKTA